MQQNVPIPAYLNSATIVRTMGMSPMIVQIKRMGKVLLVTTVLGAINQLTAHPNTKLDVQIVLNLAMKGLSFPI